MTKTPVRFLRRNVKHVRHSARSTPKRPPPDGHLQGLLSVNAQTCRDRAEGEELDGSAITVVTKPYRAVIAATNPRQSKHPPRLPVFKADAREISRQRMDRGDFEPGRAAKLSNNCSRRRSFQSKNSNGAMTPEGPLRRRLSVVSLLPKA